MAKSFVLTNWNLIWISVSITFIWPGYEICNTKSCMQILRCGSLRIIKYDENHVTEENACNDVAQFKKNLKDKLNRSLQILGVTVSSINLTYEERDGRQ